jgi:uncharacterized protein (DUF58 family)
VAAGTYLAARVVGTWELYLVSLAFTATLLVAWLLVLATGRKLTVARTLRPAQPAAGDDLAVTFRVANGSQVPGLQVTLPDATGDLGAGRQTIELASLGPLQERTATSAPQPARRGIHHLPALWAVAEDPLGLVHTRRRLGDPLQVTVYPRLVDLRSCALYADMGTRRDPGRRGFVRLGASEFRGIRLHYPGEPLSHVDWKATAKTGNLMLREMDDPTSGDITVLLDGTAALVVGEAPRSNFELAVQAAGSVADFVLEAGRGVNLLLHDSRWRQTHLAPDFNGHCRLLDSLAEATADARSPLSAALQRLRLNGGRLARTQILTLVALSLDRELVRTLAALRRDGLRVSVIHVDAGSFAPRATDTPADEIRSLLVSLAAAGVLCLTLERGDDLRAALSLSQAKSSLFARPR